MSRNAPPTTPLLRSVPLWIGAALYCLALASPAIAIEPFSTDFAPTQPKVLIIEEANATDAFRPRADYVQAMVRRGLTQLTSQPTERDAWFSLITTQDVVGLKVYAKPGIDSGTRPAVVAAVVRSLIAAGLPAKQIIIWDRDAADLRGAGYFQLGDKLGVRVVASASAGWDETNSYETPLLGSLVFGDREFEQKGDGVGRKSYVSKLVSQELTKIINLTPLLNHNTAGVCGHLYSLASGSVDNFNRFEGDSGRLAQAVPEIYALPILGDRVVLNITDALICQYEGGERGLLHYSATLNQLRFSRDPVALDLLSIKELDRQRRLARAANVRPNLELYRNAELLEIGVAQLSRIQIETLR